MLKRKKFDYSKKKYANPFFNLKRRGSIINSRSSFNFENKTKYIVIFSVLGFILLVWLFGCWSYLQINNITVNGAENLPKGEIEKSARRQANNNIFFVLPQKNIVFFSKDELVEALKEEYNLGMVIADKDWPHDIIINIEERPYAITWLEDEIYYRIDKNGNIISEADPLELNQESYPLVQNIGGEKTDKKTVAMDGKAEIILSIFEKLKNFNNFKIEKFILDNDANKIAVKLIDWPGIYFNAAGDIESQISKLSSFINGKSKNDFMGKQYIDLRYGDRVYYK
jgi:cell division septal protein FtsQ